MNLRAEEMRKDGGEKCYELVVGFCLISGGKYEASTITDNLEDDEIKRLEVCQLSK